VGDPEAGRDRAVRRHLAVVPGQSLLAACGGDGTDIDSANEAAPEAQRYRATGPLFRDLNQSGVACEPGGQEAQPGPAGTIMSLTESCTSREEGFQYGAVVFPGRLGPELAQDSAEFMADELDELGQSSLVP
jgi:hypothetical protein